MKKESFLVLAHTAINNSSLQDNMNLSTSDCSLPVAHAVSLIIANSLIAVVGTFGNFLVCAAVLYTTPRLRRCSNYLLVSLAIADLIVTMVCAPLYAAIVGKKTFVGDCAENLIFANVVASNFSCTASVINLAAISVDRFIAVIFPLRHGRIMKSYGLKVMLTVVWGVSVVSASLRGPFRKETVYMVAVAFFISYGVIVVSYVSIAISVILMKKRKRERSVPGRSMVADNSKAERRFAFTLAIVIVVFTACFFPLIFTVYVAGKSLVKMYGTAYMWILTLSLSNSAMNFLVYSARIRDFRDAFALICRKILRCV